MEPLVLSVQSNRSDFDGIGYLTLGTLEKQT